MRTLSRGAALLAFVMLVLSCGLLNKKGGDDGGAEASAAEVADTGTTPPPAALATNEGDVARFPDETKLANVPATFQRAYNVRESPPAGVLVAISVPKGTAVTQIAQRDRYFLIIFDKPGSPGTKVMGWVHKDAFNASVVDAGPLVCAAGEIALFSDTPFCGKLCSADSECPAGQACKGSATKLMKDGKPGDGVTVCTTFVPHDAGAPPPPPPTPNVDAGKLIILIDAGKAADAAPPPPPPPAGADVVAKVGGACPAGYLAVAKTNKCHRPCPTNPPPCATKNFCVKCDADQKKVCVEDRNSCK